MKALGAIRRCSRLDHMRNKTIIDELDLDSMLDNVERAQLRWYGHVKRMEPERYPRRYYEWRPAGKRPVGKPRMKWRTNIEGVIIEKRGTTKVLRMETNWKRPVGRPRMKWRTNIERVIEKREEPRRYYEWRPTGKDL
ncbi:uncharacterized protein LOC143034426 [Oratosquilla oratoria]|uniref:uncharacterized protein LOC143034426 n=1 Tax=Oratosquilla oratoria TaxID=337810 RepID=UPI003F763F1A